MVPLRTPFEGLGEFWRSYITAQDLNGKAQFLNPKHSDARNEVVTEFVAVESRRTAFSAMRQDGVNQ